MNRLMQAKKWETLKYTVAAKAPVKGKNTVVFDFAWDGPKPDR